MFGRAEAAIQPWASAIIFMGKNVENRSWKTSYRGPLLIHAAKSFKVADYEEFTQACVARDLGTPPDFAEIKKLVGGVIGSINLVDCVDASESKWFRGPYGLVLRDPKPLSFHPCSGQLGLFELAL